MSLLSIRLQNDSEIEISLTSVTQLVGMNDVTKDYIVQSLFKHFSKYRYSDDEYKQAENIKIDMLTVGRSYYDCSVVSSINDLYFELSQKKSCLLSDYVSYALCNINVSYALQKLNDDLSGLSQELIIFLQLDKMLLDVELLDFELSSILKNQLMMKLKGEENLSLVDTKALDLLITYIELMIKLDGKIPTKRLIIFNNLDRMLELEEYDVFVNHLISVVSTHDFTFIVTSSKENYVTINSSLIEGINVINEGVFNADSLEQMMVYVVNHYPYYKEFTDEEFIALLKPVMHKIGSKSGFIDVESQVVLKILNISENVKMRLLKRPNKLALGYVHNLNEDI